MIGYSYVFNRSSQFIEPLYQEYYGTPVAEDDEREENIEVSCPEK